MPTNIALRSKWPSLNSSADGDCAFSGASSLFKANTGGPINGGSHDIEGWFPVESGNHNAVNPRDPYTSVNGTTSGNEQVQVKDNATNGWATWDSQAGRGLQFQASGNFTGGTLELTTNPSQGASAKLCSARKLQIWDLNFHAYHNASTAKNFSVWIFFLNSSHNYVGSSFATPDFTSGMTWSGESEGGSRAYLHPDSGEYGHSSGYNSSYGGGGHRGNPYYSNGKAGYNFRFAPLDDTAPTNGDYRFYQIIFKIPDNSNIRGLGFRMDMDSDNQSVQIDEICLRPLNVSLKDCNGGSGTNISMATVSGN